MGKVILKDRFEHQYPKYYDIGEIDGSGTEGENFEAALSALNQIVGALSAVTEADIVETGISASVTQFSLPGAGELHKQALLNVYVLNQNDPTDTEHKAQHYVPAPVPGIFVGTTGQNAKIVDLNDTALQQYVQQVSQHAFISEHETIQLASGTQGMSSGKLVTRKTPPPTL